MEQTEPKVLFIGGSGRCGSSILREALGQHSSCGVLPFEHRFLIDPDGIVDFYSSYENTWSPYNLDLRMKRLSIFLNTLAGSRKDNSTETDWLLPKEQYRRWDLKEHILEFKVLIDQLMTDLINFKFDAKWVGGREFDGEKSIWFSHRRDKKDIRKILQKFSWAAVHGILTGLKKEVYIEDNTWNLLYARQLLDLYPNAKFVHIHRHPLDVVASFMSENWCPNDVMEAADFYSSLMDQWRHVKEQIPSESYIEVPFEAYVDNPQDIYEKICNHLDIPFETDLLKTKILSSAVGKWKTLINMDKHAALAQRLASYIGEYGSEVK
ncbi:sulfotransferase [Emcibacteraceae bacterium]|nr:sulfotransferase [Emcibacteraceae bacterium]